MKKHIVQKSQYQPIIQQNLYLSKMS